MKTDNLTPPPTDLPLNAQRFTRFYLTMLILSSFGAVLPLLGVSAIADVARLWQIAPWYSVFLAINYIAIMVSYGALALLWLKRPLGIRLKLTSYGLSIVASTGLLISGAAVLREVTLTALRQNDLAATKLDPAVVENLVSTIYYLGYSLSIVGAIGFALLWMTAWKRQQKADRD